MTTTTGAALDHDRVLQFLDSKMPHYLGLLEQMVAINSFTENIPGLNQLGEETAAMFAPLGFSAKFVANDNPHFGRHLVLTRAGGTGKRTIAFISHLDTVYPEQLERENNFSFRVEGDKVIGPGTCDIKGGTVLIYMLMDAFARFCPEVFEAADFKIMLNSSEERGSGNFTACVREELGEQPIAALIFEADSGPVTSTNPPATAEQFAANLVVTRKGRRSYRLEVRGREAHAGSKHERGVSAIAELADKILRIHELTDYRKGITTNVGLISGGTGENVVAGKAELNFEVRCTEAEDYRRLGEIIPALCTAPRFAAASDGATAAISLQPIDQMVPWPKNPGTERLAKYWQRAADACRYRLVLSARGGLSDGNNIWDIVDTIDGLGPIGYFPHCAVDDPSRGCFQEYAEISSFVPKTCLNFAAIAILLKNQS